MSRRQLYMYELKPYTCHDSESGIDTEVRGDIYVGPYPYKHESVEMAWFSGNEFIAPCRATREDIARDVERYWPLREASDA